MKIFHRLTARICSKYLLYSLFFFITTTAYAQNDNCANASVVNIPSGGFAFGIFPSSTNDLSAATVQTGETFAPAILVAGLNQKSIWYKFTLPTTRSVRVSLAQPGSAITAGDAGFAVYKASSCLPAGTNISTKLTPIGIFGSTFHPCVESGDYLVQVSGKAVANGPVYINVELAAPTALYDNQANAYQFGALGAPNYTLYVDYAVECQSIENAAEVCTSLSNYQQYNKSTWHTFTTPAYFDYVGVLFSGTGSPTYFSNSTALETFGYNLYAGDARTLPFSSLALVDGCDSLSSNGYYFDKKVYRCSELQPNTTYSIQLFFKENFNNNVRLAVTFDGTAPTQAPEPLLSLVPPSNKLGVLPSSFYGTTTSATDQLACNSRHSLHSCDPVLPAAGVNYSYNGLNYQLSTFFTFTIATTSRIQITAADFYPPYRIYSTPMLMRLYPQDITNACNSLDPNSLVYGPFLSNIGFSYDCLPPGNYTLQVLGRDTTLPSGYNYSGYLSYTNYSQSLLTDLGKKFTVSINVATRTAVNQFSLSVLGAYDSINVAAGIMQPMVDGVTYTSKIDTFGCGNTVLPWDTSCAPANSKAIYRQFIVPDSGIVSISNIGLWNKLYRGDADALATAQNIHAFPSRITGLTPYTKCLQYSGDCNGTKVCVLPGTYTHTTFGAAPNIGQTTQASFRFNTLNTVHDSPANAENMGTLVPGVNTLTSSVDYFSCKDNAIPINGYQPCTISGDTATKAIYREFYLSAPATIYISGYTYYCGYYYGGYMTLFRGRITDGITGLTVAEYPFQCFQAASTNGTCDVFQPGWYTVISYASGPTYANPFQNIEQYGYSSWVGYPSQVTISATLACPGPKYNRPYKAAVDSTTGNPFLVEWAPRAGHTTAYPKTDTTYTLYTENFNCTVDTPFASHPIPNCNVSLTKVAYYVFRTTQESYVQIDTKGFWGAVYSGNARTDSMSFGAATVIQLCTQQNGYMQICKLQPGDYTLVVFANSTQNCTSVEPSIYIDKIGYSRFDHANKAYDFGTIPPDSVYYSGKPGDVNPLDAGRAASNDFIYCTTGSQQTDPTDAACGVDFNSQIYNGSINNDLYNGTANATANPWNIPRRNLWYTFVADKGGYVRIKVNNKTIGKGYQYPFAIYKSNVDGTTPFSTVVSNGQVDSTTAQGLTYVTQNSAYYYCYNRATEISFYRDPCSSVAERYYIVVDNSNSYPYEFPGMKPNSQVEVSVMMDTVNFPLPLFDHYYQASNIGTNLDAGTYTGATDNFSCATRDATDPIYGYGPATCGKTLWYKFSTTVSGYIRFRAVINGQGTGYYYPYYIQLFRQNIPGDSTTNGLQILNASGPYAYDPAIGGYWGQTCISPGTYYIILPGCAQLNEYVYPQIQLFEQAGDFCSAPVVAPLNGPSTNVSSVVVDCHTIGTDYGEFNPTLTCPAGAQTNEYKTSWFRIDITGADTLDVTTYLTENTNATSTDIKYRLMNGNCGAMQERSCVQDALTQDTYKCLAPGSYWVQVFTPVMKNGYPVTGTISLNLSAVVHVDTCAPINPCLSNANFQKQFDCTTDEAVRFVNYSTFGSAVTYDWDFGYNGQTSIAVSPQFTYPALTTSQTYHITLTVRNNGCGGQSVYTDSITIPPRPGVDLGADTSLCNGGTLILNATSHAGSTYYWQNGSTSPTYTVTTPGRFNYYVKVTYNGCAAWDTINVNINPITPRIENKFLCGGDPIELNSSRGLGESHIWNNGSVSSSISVYTPGIYWNDMVLNGCTIRDSFIVSAAVYPLGNDREVCFGGQPVTLNATTQGATGYAWQNGATTATFNALTPGLYWVNVSFGSCSLRDSIIISNLQPVTGNITATICAGQSFTTPSGDNLSLAGVYIDTLRTTRGCDSLISTVNLLVENVTSTTLAAAICPGQTYTLPWGTTTTTAGIYRDTLRSVLGCDSVRREVSLIVQTATTQTTNPIICDGQTYTLPWGTIVTTTGIYRDTLHYTTGCDSVRREVNLTVQTWTTQITNPVICDGQTYTLPWGTIVTTTGIYRDTLHYTTGCDSVRRVVNLTVQSWTTQITNPIICDGQTYTLPWGTVATATGIYRDTLHYTTGCDSVRRVVNLTVQPWTTQLTNAIICEGQSYTLPWGAIVSVAGIYRDTLHYTTGCDSVRREVNLTVQQATTQATNPIICDGQNYTLPWGTVVTTTGIYRDTLHYTTGCDSVRRIVNLTVQTWTTQTTNPIICDGQSYTLPWGTIVTTTGIYRDTLHYTTGCDSVRREVNLIVQTATTQTTNPIICDGQSYTLPWGTVVSVQGIYRDTLHYTTGCDSVRREVNLTVQTWTTQTSNPVICDGQTYTLPWGTVVTTTGIYRDTLHYTTGCDSVRRIVNLTVQTWTTQTTNPVICQGASYTLPWGITVTTTGIYRDTLHYATGCDSVRRVVNLTVQQWITQVTNPVICAGQTYTLPWGTIVSTAGVYRDTLYYTTGCDSVRREVNLTVQQATTQTTNPIICDGQSYTLPWGTVVTTTGIYRDTLHYTTGCDSVRRIVNLTVQTWTTQTTNPVICQGASYTLPWGIIVNTAGVYRDTLHYTTGCDSIRRVVNLQVTAAAVSIINATICSDEIYTLPWGAVINTAGTYKDTVRTALGCDSLIRTVHLRVDPAPVVAINYNYDYVNCMSGTARLEASGGVRYTWTPASSLSNATIYNPVASPSATTWYKVIVTSDKGCTTEDSVQIKVITGNPDYGYLVPNAFTPNGDGRNDCFGVPTWGAVTEFEFSIYSRWGERIFYTRDPRQCWDGRYKGAEQSSNVFVYQITANGLCGKIYRKGTFTLIR